MRTLSHNAFARTELHRERVNIDPARQSCAWCGSFKSALTGTGTFLYRYSTTHDDSPSRHHAHKGLFCSKACHDSYHG